MPKFLWSGRTDSGPEEAAEVEAETPLEAKKILEARGWTALRQHTTEISDFIGQQVRDANFADDSAPTPKERVKYYEGKAPGFLRNWGQSIAAWSIVILGLVGCIVLAMRGQAGISRIIRVASYVILLLMVILLFPALRWWFGRTKRLFVELKTARTWHRWEEMLRCLDKLAIAGRQTAMGLGEYNIAHYRALALAGLGRLKEGLTCYNNAAEEAKTPPWLAHVTRSSLYVAARQYDKALEWYRQALSEEPDKPTICLDAGVLLVQRFNDPGEAKQLLARAEKAQLSELERIYVPYLRGIIAFREKDYAAMDQNMREAFAMLEKRSATKFYIFEGSLLTCQGYLAVSSAGLGRKDEAQRYFAQSEKYLRVLELNDLLKEYEVLAGHP